MDNVIILGLARRVCLETKRRGFFRISTTSSFCYLFCSLVFSHKDFLALDLVFPAFSLQFLSVLKFFSPSPRASVSLFPPPLIPLVLVVS